MKVVLIKFQNGEELVAEEVKSTDITVTVKNAIRVMIIPPQGPNQPPSVGFAEWIPYITEKIFTFNKKDILVYGTPVSDLTTQYNNIFSPIKIPNTPKIILDN